MGFWSLLEVASMPVIQVLFMSLVGAFMASDRCKLFPVEARNSMNKVVFVLFAPALMFANLAQTVTLEDIISWWFMPVNMGLTFLIGGLLGWLVVKILKPPPYLEGLIVATCSAGNMGNLPIILVPAICDEDKSPFGNRSVCRTVGLSYASFSMALGGFYIWTYTFRLIKGSAMKVQAIEESEKIAIKSSNSDLEADHKTHLLGAPEDKENKVVKEKTGFWRKGVDFLHEILEELLAPPTLGAIIGFIFGAVRWLRNLIIGDDAPLRIVQSTAKLLGDGTIPCMTIILGGNLIQGLRSSAVKPMVVLGIVCVRYIAMPIIGIGIVLTAANLGFLPADPLFQYVLMLQFTLPPAMNIGTMTQLYNVAQDECSVLMLWTYLVAILALTVWSTIFLHLLV
ncbi:Protein PIN-LIKES 5 [Arabidopsis thaliana]|jgi:predicted permease|uniref:Protein PIN-LIKES 5 n=4 Tax=Arabidopsis TaxID=3701 RepID=PILS5_ARATH|nr:Auxin efflux carrier family protein [Arabidopsis thaliana]NP_565417.1 Auxin efflux carrier family protein [Arabidopsis thaliana]NP_849964.1 Auxin efflux carrier family protein [Arabidopsis thaliana]NP_973479.1 Auxin efflux carrier family protein [Arabidopsis thaliana]Q9SHL8.1 RecName: Full=Protein PIN-LIKES 5; AltName: Full=Auxin efflux carrier-like protein 5 [Arabidopsis thaliana]KAG7636480.1 Membrane transport protein [Arabidopsis thaliana x Arabidopsis arenosa]KAG7641102.1 Membrane tran|eukprot:NP_001031363.1 Auxin efflux carrier family protein [Arabidopsis thaliana]